MKALIVIDYTVDFVANDGKLTCGEPGQQIEKKIVEVIKEYIENDDIVIFANDIHYKDDIYHPETTLFPPHNIAGTNGRLLYGKVQQCYENFKENNNVFAFDKTRYSAFAGTPLDLILGERNIKDISLVGVCTDICVLHTAVDAYNKSYNITVFKDGVASFNALGHEWALAHFTNTLGAKVI